MASRQSDNQSGAAERGALPDDEALLREARRLLPALSEQEPRPGFAQRVAARAAEEQAAAATSWLPSWLGGGALRWTLAGAAVASALALIVVARSPAPVSPGPAGDLVAQLDATGPELQLAQRLDLYEDLSVVQDQEALEDMDVVSVLHELQPEGKP
jgi:anti-sigma-K factor RskA